MYYKLQYYYMYMLYNSILINVYIDLLIYWLNKLKVPGFLFEIKQVEVYTREAHKVKR